MRSSPTSRKTARGDASPGGWAQESPAAASRALTETATLNAHLQLAMVPRIGPRNRRRLLEVFGCPEAVFAATEPQLLAIEGIGPVAAQAIQASSPADAAELLGACQREQVQILLEGDPRYPSLLREIDDPPGVLFVRGELQPCDGLAVALVGARHATAYGTRVAEQLGSSLARAGYTVVSGLARGIDAAGHRGALAAGGRTLAVLGSGVLKTYPPEHRGLADDISRAGAVLSECPPLAAPTAGAFPQRNRIISGLSLGVVVIQAADRSGAMITARLAGEQGREVFAVPGEIHCRMSQGCHRLIQDGAKLVGSIDDILDELGPLSETVVSPAGCQSTVGVDPTAMDPAAMTVTASPAHPAEGRPAERLLETAEQLVFDAIPTSTHGSLIDQVIAQTGLTAADVLAALSMLETRRLIQRLPGSRVTRR